MPNELEVEACGEKHRLLYTIGAIREIAKVNPMLEDMVKCFEQGVHKYEEVEVILNAGFKAAGSSMTAARFIEDQGYKRAVETAYRGLGVMFLLHDPGKNVLSPTKEKKTSTDALESKAS